MDTVAALAQMIRQAERHAEAMSADRIKATEYAQGVMTDMPADKGRSSVVSREVRAHVKKVLPSVIRTLLGGDQVAEYQPVGPGDEEGAAQASDYINSVVLPECEGYAAIESAVHDALLLRNGVLKWWFDERKEARVSDHTGLPDDAFAELVNGAEIEVLEHTERQEETELGPITVHDVRIKRIITRRDIRAAAVPRERFLIHPDAVTLADSVLTGEKMTVTRSDLVAMGYDKKKVWALQQGGDDDPEAVSRRDGVTDTDEAQRANEQIDYYDVFVRYDADDDGIAELRHVCFAGGLAADNLLMDDDADEVQFCDLKVMSQPHQWQGVSLFDDLQDIQRVQTALLRNTLDNLYWQNNLQPIVQEEMIVDMAAVMNPEFGLPIRVKPGADVRAAVGYNIVPFVAKESFAMMEYMDQEAQDRTGITDASAGLAPDALQNMTAKASAMIEQQGIGQTELMVKTLAQGLRVFFRGLLRMVVKHQDVPRTVRLRGEWVQFDPRQWNAEMDCTVNTGLGAGTRERDMQVMQSVMVLQEKLLSGFGPDNPFVKPDNVYSALEKLVQAAGLKDASKFFTKPDPQEVQARLDAAKQAPSPDMMKVQAQAEADKAKLQLDQQRAQAEMQLSREKAQAEMQLAREKMQMEFALKREQMRVESTMRAQQTVGDGVRFGGAVG